MVGGCGDAPVSRPPAVEAGHEKTFAVEMKTPVASRNAYSHLVSDHKFHEFEPVLWASITRKASRVVHRLPGSTP